MCSETTSPRISYSLDLVGQSGAEFHRYGNHHSSYSLGPNHDFDFGHVEEHGVCSAEELFGNGTILPVHMRSTSSITGHREGYNEGELQPLPFLSPICSSPVNKAMEQRKSNGQVTEPNTELEKKVQSRSFWGFKRSNSDDGNKLNLLFPIPDLCRSRSVSSVAVKKQQQQQRSEMAKSYSLSACACPFPQRTHSMRKSRSGGGSYYGNNGSSSRIRVSPVLNVPLPPPKGAVNFFGLGCFYVRGKDKKSNSRT